MQPNDTAYPRLKSNINVSDLIHWYTPAPEELIFCDSIVRKPNTRLGFLLALKTFQRLGYFVPSDEIPDVIIDHIAGIEEEIPSRVPLRQYDQSRSRKTHICLIREFLDVKSFDDEARQLLSQALIEAALIKEDLADIINIGIELLVRYRYELPAFSTLERQARIQRSNANQKLFGTVYDRLQESGRTFLDKLFIVGDNPSRTSPWNDLKRDAPKPTIDGLRDVVAHYDELVALSHHVPLLSMIPVAKLNQLALEGFALDAARMINMEPRKRYAVTLALIKRQLARVADDLAGAGAQIDTTTSNGRLFFGIFAALAEFERELIAERTHAGLAAARARGRQGGRPRKMNRSTLMMAMTAMADPKANAVEIARHLDMTTTTLYAYVNGDGSLKQAGQALLMKT